MLCCFVFLFNLSIGRFSKLGLFDDNNSFFSSNTFQPSYLQQQQKHLQQTTQLRNNDANSPANSPQLPDLLNGIESDKEKLDILEKLSLLKGLGEFNSQLNSLNNSLYGNPGLYLTHTIHTPNTILIYDFLVICLRLTRITETQ